MPIQFSEKGPSTINVILGYGDIGIGQILGPNYKGIGLVQLKDRFKTNEPIPEDQQQGSDTIKVCLVFRNQRGLAELRKALSAIEETMGLSSDTMLDRITNHYMSTIGDLEAEIERLKYELKQATNKKDKTNE